MTSPLLPSIGMETDITNYVLGRISDINIKKDNLDFHSWHAMKVGHGFTGVTKGSIKGSLSCMGHDGWQRLSRAATQTQSKFSKKKQVYGRLFCERKSKIEAIAADLVLLKNFWVELFYYKKSRIKSIDGKKILKTLYPRCLYALRIYIFYISF